MREPRLPSTEAWLQANLPYGCQEINAQAAHVLQTGASVKHKRVEKWEYYRGGKTKTTRWVPVLDGENWGQIIFWGFVVVLLVRGC